MRMGLISLVSLAVCMLIATAAVAEVISDALGNQVWDEYISRFIRVAKAKGIAAATARNQQIMDLIAQQHAFNSWTDLTAQAAKDLGAEKWNEITKAKTAELKAQTEALQAEKAKEAAEAAEQATGEAAEQASGTAEKAKGTAGEAVKKLPEAAKKLPVSF